MIDVHALLQDPALATRLPQPEAARLLAALEGLSAVVRLAATARATPEPEANGDGLITPEEAARLAGLTLKQLYRRKIFRPAMVRVGHRTLRVNEQKLRRLLATVRA